MKSRITIFFLAVLAFSSFIYPQTGPFPKTERELANKKNIEKEAPRNNPPFNEPSNSYNSSEIQASVGKAYAAEPTETSSYVPGAYYVEGFESKALPSDWQTRSITGNAVWTTTNRESFIGGRCAYIERETGYGVTGIDWLISPQYSAALGDSLVFYLSTYITGYAPDTLWVLVSEASDVPTDGAALNAAFSDTLLVIAADTLEDGWYKYSVSLSEYADKQIYIGFKELNKSGCGVYLDDISLGESLAKDIAFSNPYIDYYSTVRENHQPSMYFVNRGYETQSFQVACEIPAAGYSSSQSVSDLKPGDKVHIGFSWLPENAGEYEITVRSTLLDDGYADNNIYIDTVNIVDALNPAVWVYSETGRPQSMLGLGTASYITKTGEASQPFAGGIYMFGGYSSEGSFYSDSIYFYDMNTRKWSSKNAVFPAAIRSIRTVQAGGKIYIPGGYLEGSGPSSSLFIYDVESDVLTQGANMLEAASGYVIGSYRDTLIYVMGGSTSNKVQIYNINTNTWTYGTPMIYQRSSAAGSIAGNKIVVAAGYNSDISGNLSSAEIGVIDPNNPYLITWSLDEYPGGLVANHSGGSWYAKNMEYIFFTGGFRTEKYGSSVIGETWAYDVKNDKWLSCPGKYPTESGSDIVPVYRNDSVFVSVMGGYLPSYFGAFRNEWMYLGKYEAPLSVYSKDIAAVSSIQPDTIIASSPAIFEAAFKNRQLTSLTFDVKMEVTPGDFTSTKTISSLSYEAASHVVFDAWIPAAGGNYTVKIYPSIEGDEDASNDTLTIEVYAQKVDIVAGHIKSDVDLYPLVSNAPVVYFVNTGDQEQSFDVTMQIAQAAYTSVKSVLKLAAGDTAAVTFDQWTPDSSGSYAVKVYSSLAADENKVNDTLKVSIQVQKVDAASSRLVLSAPVFAMAGITPMACFVNNGGRPQTFSVVMNIKQSSYSSIKTVKDLVSGDSTIVSFDSWTPAISGSYDVEIYVVTLFNDEVKTNDTLRTVVFVEKTDYSSTKINIASLPYSGKAITPKASFENRGTQPQTFNVSMSITPGDYYSEKTVADLDLYTIAEVEFDSWTPDEAGIYNVKIYSGAANDEDKNNDTLKTVIHVLDELNAGVWHSEELIPEYFNNKRASSYTLRYAAGDESFIFIISPYSNVPGYEVDSSHSYNTESKVWIDRQAPGFEYIDYKAIYAQGKIYVPGGLKIDSLTSNELRVYNPINNQWTREAELPKASAFHELGVYGDSLIYVIGGADKTKDSVITHNIVQIYNVKSKSWKEGSVFEGKFKKAHTGGIIKNKIVLAGGADYKTGVYSDQLVIGTIDSLNPYNIAWETSASPAGMLYGTAAAACNSKQGSYVIFAGGRKTDNTISSITLAYDPVESKWYRGADAKAPSSLSSGITIARNDSLYFAVLGGENDAAISGLNEWLYLGEAIKDTSLIGINNKPLGPLTYSLSQNYPNPFNPSTIIRYSVAQAEQIELKIYNMLGQEVITLVNEFKSAGVYEARFNAAGLNLSSGVYLYRIKAGSFVQTKKLMLIK